MPNNISGLDCIVCGLAYTSRTETLEDYFKDKVRSLTVIALSGCFLKDNLSSCRVYERGLLKKEFKLPNFRIPDYKWYRQPLVILVFFFYWISICYAFLRLKRRYDVYIGVSHSFALWGALLKKTGLVKRLIYYCLDYYIPGAQFNFNNLFVKSLNIVDRFTVRNADFIWDLSPKIPEYRQLIGNIKIGSYKNTIVPLGYSRPLRRFRAMNEINRWDIGFVGSITASQGLQLLLEAMPLVLKEFPQIKVMIIGQGPYLNEIKNSVKEKGLEEIFRFLGFIKDQDKMLDILSRCAIAVALYSDSVENKNIICADPGKTKLYALLGLSVITTKSCSLSEDLIRNKAGVVIDYKAEELKSAICYLMTDDQRLREVRQNSFNLGESFVSDVIFDKAIKEIKL